MARPELPVGTWGKIRTEKLGPHRFRARARFRDYDGKTRDVEATGATEAAAVAALKVKLRDRTTPNNDEVTRETHVSTLADLWIEEITAEERLAPQTIHQYQTSLRTTILPPSATCGSGKPASAASRNSCEASPQTGRQQPRVSRSPSASCSPWPSVTAPSRPTPYGKPVDCVNRAALSSLSPTYRYTNLWRAVPLLHRRRERPEGPGPGGRVPSAEHCTAVAKRSPWSGPGCAVGMRTPFLDHGDGYARLPLLEPQIIDQCPHQE